MEELLAVIVQIVIEVIFEALSSMPIDFFFRYDEDKPEFRKRACLFVAGCFGGYLSVWLLPGTILHHGWSRLVNLIASPLLAGWVAVLMARWLVRHDKHASSRIQFWRAFWFTLGLTVVRFACAQRG